MSLAWAAYRVAAPCIGALAPAARVFASAPEAVLWNERLGGARLEGGAHAWVHSASLGEAVAVPPLVRELVRLQPAARCFLTSHTRAGRVRLAETGLPVSLAPIDSPQASRRFFAGVAPERLLLLETELWPHWLMRAATERVPVAVLSARLSATSVRRYRSLGPAFRGLVARLDAVLCQSGEDVERWIAIGAPPDRVSVVGNLKHDAVVTPSGSRASSRAALGLDPARPLLVLGSVRPGEGRMLAHAWMTLPEDLRARWQVAFVPRHARAVPELREELSLSGVPIAGDGVAAPGAWRIDERAGVLMGYYAAADLAFVGGSLMPYGGHNPIEPAAAGAAVLMGRHHAAQLPAVRALAAGEGITLVDTEEDLARALERLARDAGAREAQARNAARVAERERGASRRAVERLEELGLWPVS